MTLLTFTLIAILWVNSPFEASYVALWHQKFAGLSAQLWINDGLMAVFFLFIGLEIKRELFQGELTSIKKAALPVAAAIGGMIVPAFIYIVFNPASGETFKGWGIPIATDIAFALGILSLLGPRVPKAIKTFLGALAIADDLGAILVIALFYTVEISWIHLALGLSVFAILLTFNRLGIKKISWYLLFGVVGWYGFLKSGVHATIAGVFLATVIPLESGKRLERILSPWITFAVMPLFAFANAGIHLTSFNLGRVGLGVLIGLTIGKPIGIFSFSWLAVKGGLAHLPNQVHFKHIYGAACLGGIGFTMSIFISHLAFLGDANLHSAKLGILLASVASALWGLLVLFPFGPKPKA